MSLRIQVSAVTVKALHARLLQAYLQDDVRLVRRITVLLDLLVHQVPMAVLCERWGLSSSCLYAWQRAFLLHGLESLRYRHSGGRRPKRTSRQKNRLVELLEASPQVVGCETAKRLAWLQDKWPTIVRAARRRNGLILFEDEASFAQGGSLSYTWSKRGQQPEVPPSGKRKGYEVFGAIEYFSGRLCYEGLEGRFASGSYQAFLQMILAQTSAHIFLIHDGARYHTSASTQAFLAAHRDRITAEPLPSYSPDYNPIEYLWQKTKQRATHNKYFQEFIALTISLDKALAYFAMHPDTVLGLFGRYGEEGGLELKQVA